MSHVTDTGQLNCYIKGANTRSDIIVQQDQEMIDGLQTRLGLQQDLIATGLQLGAVGILALAQVAHDSVERQPEEVLNLGQVAIGVVGLHETMSKVPATCQTFAWKCADVFELVRRGGILNWSK